MPWRCQQCDEEHADQFDACWRCAEIASTRRSGESKALIYIQQYALLVTKFGAVFAVAMIAFTGPLFQQQGVFNGFTALFLGSLVCLLPRIRWIPPLVMIGFCIGPTLFAPTIRDSAAFDVNSSVTGAACGLVLGISFSMFGGK